MDESQLVNKMMNNIMESIKLYNIGKLHYDNKRDFQAGDSYGQILNLIMDGEDYESMKDVVIKDDRIDTKSDFFKTTSILKHYVIRMNRFMQEAGLDNDTPECSHFKDELSAVVQKRLDSLDQQSIISHLSKIRTYLQTMIGFCVTKKEG